jgi:NAD(P)H dehydrogenase (quinone)
MLKKISKVLVVISSPVYKYDQRSNTINLLCKEFIETLQKKSIDLDLIDLYQESVQDLTYKPEEPLSKDVESFQAKIITSDLIVFFHPIWWGGLPAVLKGFVESVLHKGFAYKYERNFLKPLLKGKKVIVITTGTKPDWFYRFIDKNFLYLFWKRSVCDKTGMELYKFLRFCKIRKVSDKKIEKWQKQMQKLANKISLLKGV